MPVDSGIKRRWIVGEECGDVFQEGDEFDGITVTIELHSAAEARAVTAAQSHMNAADMHADRIAALQAAIAIGAAALLTLAGIGFYLMLTATLAAMPDIIAESAARAAW